MQITDVRTCSQSMERFSCEVDDATVWCPDSGSYDTWICQLLGCLIGSGSIHDELFQLLSPVCCIKVHTAYMPAICNLVEMVSLCEQSEFIKPPAAEY